ncbi:MAG: 4'-phosphopantetheinyl transferase family protein, partial [Candidatus Rokuibacteriota bacterium]
RERAARFHFPRDRRRFIAGRGLLRAVLARYLGTAASAVRIRGDAGRKPQLHGPDDGGLRFNVAHSEDLALYAVAWQREVGIDVERIRPELDWAALAARFFSPPERAALAGAGAEAAALFTRLWVAKEAYLKATGLGLAGRLDQAPAWRIAGLDVGPDYAAAVAAEGQGWRVVLADWGRESVSAG